MMKENNTREILVMIVQDIDCTCANKSCVHKCSEEDLVTSVN